MQDKAKSGESIQEDLITRIAGDHGISLEFIDEHDKIECLCYVYAHVIEFICEELKERIISKESIEDMKKALNQIHIKFIDFQEYDKLKEGDIKYTDIEDILPQLADVLAELDVILDLYDDAHSEQLRRKNLRAYSDALRQCKRCLLECCQIVPKINKRIKAWRHNLPENGCQGLRSAG